MDRYTLIKVIPRDVPLSIYIKGRGDKPIWPSNLAQEAIVYVDPAEGSTTGSGEAALESKGSQSGT